MGRLTSVSRTKTTGYGSWPTSSPKEIVPGCETEYAAGGGPDLRCYRVNCEKIGRVLPDFRPEWNARKGAQELYQAYRDAGLKASDISRRYIRLIRIQELMKAGQLDTSLRQVAQLAEPAVVA